MSIKVALLNDEVTQAIAAVRSDSPREVDWVVIGHHENNPNTIALVAKGSGGIEELRANLDPSQVQYALYRTTEVFDLSNTTKFVYVYNLGKTVPYVQKGRFGVVKGDVVQYFNPFHVDIEITDPSELTEEDVREKIKKAAGTMNQVREIDFVEGRQERGFTAIPGRTVAAAPKPGKTVGVVSTQSQGVAIDDSLVEAIKDVRNDKTSTNWCLGTYQDNDIKKPIVEAARGDGGVEDLTSHLSPKGIYYGLIRVVDVVDNHKTIKFAFVIYIGNEVPFVTKAKIATHKGGVSAAFANYHVDFNINDAKEISDAIVLNKVASYSGSKSFVM